ncbi:hypothetical protein GCM10022237_07200 [Nocardioides ginsengisoli]|uniref:Uncharacterized protein n=1 Tax=Nocardioides ginsengisoli TaxID=363868 RepID=A0ABW3VUD6_9ACTN
MTLLHTVLRRTGRGLAAGFLVGIAVGVLSRAMMRVVALVFAREEPGFHLGDSLAIVGMLTVVTMIGGVVLALWQVRGRWLAYLLAAALVIGLHVPEALVVLEPDNTFLLTGRRWAMLDATLVVWTLALLVLVGLVARLTSERVSRAAVPPPAPVR